MNRRVALLLAIGLMILLAGINQPAFFEWIQRRTAEDTMLTLMFLFGLAEIVEEVLPE